MNVTSHHTIKSPIPEHAAAQQDWIATCRGENTSSRQLVGTAGQERVRILVRAPSFAAETSKLRLACLQPYLYGLLWAPPVYGPHPGPDALCSCTRVLHALVVSCCGLMTAWSRS